jgi:hypothetical protein
LNAGPMGCERCTNTNRTLLNTDRRLMESGTCLSTSTVSVSVMSASSELVSLHPTTVVSHGIHFSNHLTSRRSLRYDKLKCGRLHSRSGCLSRLLINVKSGNWSVCSQSAILVKCKIVQHSTAWCREFQLYRYTLTMLCILVHRMSY